LCAGATPQSEADDARTSSPAPRPGLPQPPNAAAWAALAAAAVVEEAVFGDAGAEEDDGDDEEDDGDDEEARARARGWRGLSMLKGFTCTHSVPARPPNS